MKFFPARRAVQLFLFTVLLGGLYAAACDSPLIQGQSGAASLYATSHRSTYSTDGVQVVISGIVPPGADEIEGERIVEIVHDAFLVENPGRYGRATVRVVFNEADRPGYLQVFLLYRESYNFDSAKVTLGDDYAVALVEFGYDFSQDDESSYAGAPEFLMQAVTAGECPDESVQFVFSISMSDGDQYPGLFSIIDQVYNFALAKGYKAVKLTGQQENVAAMKNWLSCGNVVAWGRIGHGNTSSLVLDDGVLDATWFNSLSTIALNNKVIFTNSCRTHNIPLQPAIVHAGVQKFIGGVSDLTIGKSELVFRCFWDTIINQGGSMPEVLASCKATWSPIVNTWGISGNGSNYLTVREPVTPPPVGYPPVAPVMLKAQAGDANVQIAWGAVDDASGYSIRYGQGAGSYSNTIAAGNVTSYQVSGLSNGTKYFFVVSARNQYGESAVSNEMSATPVAPAPEPDPAAWGTISGTCMVNGVGVSQALVTVRKDGTNVAQVRTGADGRFSVGVNEPGGYSLTILYNSASTVKFSGTLLFNGRGLQNMPVVLYVGSTVVERKRIDATGSYFFNPVAGGQCKIMSTLTL